MSKKKSTSLKAFEGELTRLQEAVERLESQDLRLEEAFQELEAGCASYKACREILETARERVEILTREFPEDEPTWEPFGAERIGGEEEA